MDESSLLLRQIPHSIEAEQSVLGAMLIDARCIPDVVEALTGEDFYLKANREIYETIYTMFNFSATIDPVTVLDQMKLTGVYDENTSRSYLLQLMEITPTAANVKEYIRIVKDKALLRRIAETAGELTTLVQEGGDRPGRAGFGRAAGLRHPPGPQRPGAGAPVQNSGGRVRPAPGAVHVGLRGPRDGHRLRGPGPDPHRVSRL